MSKFVDAIGIVCSVAGPALAFAPDGRVSAFAEPVAELPSMIARVEKRLKKGRKAGAVRAITNWLDTLDDAVVAAIPGGEKTMPEPVRDAVHELIVWAASLATGVPYEPQAQGPARVVVPKLALHGMPTGTTPLVRLVVEDGTVVEPDPTPEPSPVAP